MMFACYNFPPLCKRSNKRRDWNWIISVTIYFFSPHNGLRDCNYWISVLPEWYKLSLFFFWLCVCQLCFWPLLVLTLLSRWVSVEIGRAIAQAVSRRFPTAAARFQTRVGKWDFVMDKSGAGAGFLRELRFPLPIYIPSCTPQSSSLSPEAGTIGQEWPQCL
jgi:hypothetical protein